MKAIQIENLSVSYGNNLALNKVSIELTAGELIGIIGPNGSGKSTLLKATLDLLPHSGKILFSGKSFKEMREKIAYVPQRETVDWDFPISVFDVVAMGTLQPKKWWQKLSKEDKENTTKAIEDVGLTGFENRRIGNLSGGQQQRVFIARSLVQNPDFFLLDEPFVGIDIQSQTNILDLLKKLKTQGKTILMVHHDLSDAAKHFDSTLLLNNELIAFGKTEDVLKREVLEKVYPNLFIV
jgi:manganese transport system ATP-binding protein